MTNEEIAIEKYLNGEKWSCSTFIDEETITVGYGKLDNIGCFEFELPFSFRSEHNIMYGCKKWSELDKMILREKKLERISK